MEASHNDKEIPKKYTWTSKTWPVAVLWCGVRGGSADHYTVASSTIYYYYMESLGINSDKHMT